MDLTTADDKPFIISLVNSGETYPCRAADSLLAGMLMTGRKGIPSGCRGGGCGVCLVEIKSGTFATRAMSSNHIDESARAHNRLLACRVFPRSDLAVEVLGKMQRAIWRDASATSSSIPIGLFINDPDAPLRSNAEGN